MAGDAEDGRNAWLVQNRLLLLRRSVAITP